MDIRLESVCVILILGAIEALMCIQVIRKDNEDRKHGI